MAGQQVERARDRRRQQMECRVSCAPCEFSADSLARAWLGAAEVAHQTGVPCSFCGLLVHAGLEPSSHERGAFLRGRLVWPWVVAGP